MYAYKYMARFTRFIRGIPTGYNDLRVASAVR